jgi:hypothetical protein
MALGVLAARTASAQVTDPVDFTTTFPFVVGNTLAPAGRYELRPGGDNPQVLELTGHHIGVFFEVQPTVARRTPSNTEVVFERYGDNYVLKNVWVAGGDSGSQAVAAEREQHQMKQGNPIAEQHVAGRTKSRS